ncbi:MAG: glycosyltransferase [Desulfobacterales bacterium]
MSKTYSVIIPAYNEEKWLPRTLDALNTAMQETDRTGEIIVTDNNSTDKTGRIAHEYGARVVFEPIRQIARARNAGAKAAKGNWLIFLDADTIITPAILKTALKKLESGTCCGGGIRVDFGTVPSPFVQKVVDFWNMISLKFGLAAGSFVFCLREAFEAAGGFDEKVYASEEIGFSLKIRRWGQKRGMDFCIIRDEFIASSPRKLYWFSPVQTWLFSLSVFLIPFAPFSRTLCRLWYKRPSDPERAVPEECPVSMKTAGWTGADDNPAYRHCPERNP